tara:strand:- start:2698 stop:3279 length:582 start_codon:yes stop_codon:yes gene_type:complete
MSTLETNLIQPATGTTLTVGASGDTIDIPSGATLDATGATITGALTSTPSFFAYLGSDQSVSDATFTKCTVDTELYDTGGCFDHTTNYRFTPTTAGKYIVHYGMTLNPFAADDVSVALVGIYKNGSLFLQPSMDFGTHPISACTINGSQIFDFNGSSDYIELWGYLDEVAGGGAKFNSYKRSCYLGASLIVGA